MAENRQPSSSKIERKRERQPISVPFVWEEKPGTPKRDWKPTARPVKPVEPPTKLVVSVPFGWEVKPGTPLPYFSQPPTEEPNFIYLSPPKYSDSEYGNQNRKGDEPSDSEIDTYSFTTSESFSSAKSLLANGLIPTAELSSAVPVQQEKASHVLTNTNGGQLQSPAPEVDGIETTGFAGASFLEWLFPLLVQNSGFTDKIGCMDKSASQKADKEFLHGSNRSQVGKPLLTLGELIVMSRRRSYQRKAIKMQKQTSMNFMKRNPFACSIFGNGSAISGLHMKWKRQLQLKLM